jgi:hypothetical protein
MANNGKSKGRKENGQLMKGHGGPGIPKGFE